MTIKNVMVKVKSFFTVRNSLILVICILSLILIVQNINRYSGHRPSRNFGGSVTNTRPGGGFGGMGLPGMGGGMNDRRSAN